MTITMLKKTSFSILCALLAACSSDTPADTGPDAFVSTEMVPSEEDALNEFLVASGYTSFEAEAAVHASIGPHGQVRIFYNDLLAQSLRAANTEHPVGAAVVKELYDSAGTELSGWAAMVKTRSGTSDGSWYFYEVLSVVPGAEPVARGQGVAQCAGCHGGGTDYILSDGWM